MCGIAGYASAGGFESASANDIALSMANAITHRGPDDSGVWVDPQAGVALAHRRLSILDLSSAGHQPMISVSGRYVIVFNGEIYNHNDISNELDVNHYQREGTSDTESLLLEIGWARSLYIMVTITAFFSLVLN